MNKLARAIVNGNELKVVRFFEWDKIRNMCINKGYYTCGDNADYMDLCTFITEHRTYTDDRLLYIASDIYNHSDDKLFTDLNFNEALEVIACNILDNTMYYVEVQPIQ